VSWLVYVVILIFLFGMLFVGQSRRRRQVAEEMVRLEKIGFGDEVMTTSGLYGTVVGRNDDGTVQLAIAPGVEVKWALAALRNPESLPDQYRQGFAGGPPPGHPDADTEPGTDPEAGDGPR
jgi:preprotein translocase subunit YajC